MRKPRDIKAEIEALRAREIELKAAHRSQLLELLERTGADRLDPELLAGVLLAAVEAEKAGAGTEACEAWRQRGEAFFRPRDRTTRNGSASPPSARDPGCPDPAPPGP